MRYAYLLIFSLVIAACTSGKKEKEISTADLLSASDSLVLVGEQLISTALYERDFAVSPQAEELIYTQGDYKQNHRCLVWMKREKGQWTLPEVLSISGQYQDIEPFYNTDGNRLFFASNRPIFDDESRSDYNIWYSDRTDNGWAEPVALDSVINTRGDEFYPSITEQGQLYFTATREEGFGREDIFVSEWKDGQYQYPKLLPEAINSGKYEFNAYISPDGQLIIFSSFGREDGFGGGDLYISRKDTSGNWMEAVNMGAGINSDKLDYCPFIDWNSGNFYFTSERISTEPVIIHDTKRLKQWADSTQNGFGDIYKISLHAAGIIK